MNKLEGTLVDYNEDLEKLKQVLVVSDITVKLVYSGHLWAREKYWPVYREVASLCRSKCMRGKQYWGSQSMAFIKR